MDIWGNILMLNTITSIIQTFAIILFSMMATNKARVEFGEGHISYLNAFLLSFIISFFSLLIFLLVELLIFYVLDPNYLNNMLNTMMINIEMQKEMMPEQYQSYVTPKTFSQAFSFKYQLRTAVIYLIGSVTMSLILAAFMKKYPSIN